MTVQFDSTCLSRLLGETSKLMEIDNIFTRLRQSEAIQLIYQLYGRIFENEHQFTIEELTHLSKQKQPGSYSLQEQYKLNSHIFKQNLTLISNLIIEDIWVSFNRLVNSETFENSQPEQQKQRESLFLIEEESQIDNFRTDCEVPIIDWEKFSQQTKDNPQTTIEIDLGKENNKIRRASDQTKIVIELQQPHQNVPRILNGSNSHRLLSQEISQQVKKSLKLGGTPRYQKKNHFASSSQNNITLKYLQQTRQIAEKNKPQSSQMFFSNQTSYLTQNKNRSDKKKNQSADSKIRNKQVEGEVKSPTISKSILNTNLQGLIQKMTFSLNNKK